MSKTIFERIIDREIPAQIVFEDEHCLAFRDVHPQAPTHVLVIPKRVIRSVAEIEPTDTVLVGHLLWVCRRVAELLELGTGFRVVANSGADAGQSVDHLHFHVLGGRALSWPPG